MSSQPVFAQSLGPLDPERSELVARVVEGLDAPSLQWLSGFAAGIAFERAQGGRSGSVPLPTPAARAEAQARLAVIYGSQTGNGKRIAERLGRAAEAAGLAVRVQSTRDYPLKDLAKERLLVVVMSTHGDGDRRRRRSLSTTSPATRTEARAAQYSVLALATRAIRNLRDRPADRRTPGALGARLVARVDCDLD
jgi:sulfite reductase (NADPH) flavoprotein alpha-component